MTGDLGWMDEQGYLRITGRKKDMIVRGGHNIFPARVEALAMRHAAVDKAAAFPVTDARGWVSASALSPSRCTPARRLSRRRCCTASRWRRAVALRHAGVSIVPAGAAMLTASGKIIKRDLVAGVAEGRLHPIPVRFQAQAAE